MIVRIRSPQGLTRIEVEEGSRWNQVVSLSRRLSEAFGDASLTVCLPFHTASIASQPISNSNEGYDFDSP